jgi:hypothetical protein
MTLSITMKKATFSIMAECCYAELSVVTRNVVILIVANRAFMLIVVMLNVVMQSVVAPSC